tara:strand:+ start:284 stop:1999 length:1716 start_codon:yes stop_codon:yes gene_type:complete
MNNIIESVFKELIDKGVLIVEKQQPEETESKGEGGVRTVLKLPKFKINEKNWGTKLDTEDRAIIEQIGANLEGDDPLSRIDYVNNFLEQQSEIKGDITVGKVMGTLMFLDIFASIVYEFNAAVAGFLFEAMFAGIFEGEQIEAKLGGGEAGTTDVVLYVGKGKSKKGVEYSFKLLGEGATIIQGSASDILSGIKKASDAKEVYLIGLKREDSKKVMSIDFYEFDVTQQTWFDWIGTVNPRKNIKEPIYGEVEFTIDDAPILKDKTRLATSQYNAKVINDEVVLMPRSGSKARKTFDAAPEELTRVFKINPEVLQEPHNLQHVNGTPVKEGEYLIPGDKYRVNGIKEVKIKPNYYDQSSNFYKLYGPLLEKGSFNHTTSEGKTFTDFTEYVSSGAYKTDTKFFKMLEDAPLPAFKGGKGAGQFTVTQNYMKNKAGTRGPNTVTLDREKFQQAAARYTNVIGDKIYEVFTDMANLVEDVSGYYLGNTVKERFEMGLAAKEEAERLAKSTEENFKEIEVEEETRKALEKSARRRAASRSGFDTGAGKYGGFEESKVVDLNHFSKKILENIKKTP